MTSIKIVYQKKKKISDTFIINFLRILFCLKVFIGEKLSARVSHLHIRVDNTEKITKTKSSGLCVSTGTGSTSWHTRYIVPFEKKKIHNLKVFFSFAFQHQSTVKKKCRRTFENFKN
jgi:hypothetical protein